ncbi:MAG TPA: Crp/Fnr family transcriptional regulator [Saprospiraceae bacterium]|nr:Crp/Fnr family transcriptional regulator [Saprospiraceae bacterium]HMP24239.1 Crp/Fnr family transcriptional regulator [Saprospiraceae bacterium]
MDLHLNPNNQLNGDTDVLKMIELIGTKKSVKKNTPVLCEGDKCDFFFFVLSGVFRAYRFVEDKEVTIGFSFPGDIDTCPYSYVNNLPSLDIIQALTDSTIIKVNKADYLEYIRKNKVPDITDQLLANYIEILMQRLIAFRALTAEVNYINLLARNPKEVSKIQLTHIASYLGVSLERISRIRKKNALI